MQKRFNSGWNLKFLNKFIMYFWFNLLTFGVNTRDGSAIDLKILQVVATS